MMELNIDEKKGTLTVNFSPSDARSIRGFIKGMWELKETLQATVLAEMENMTPEQRAEMAQKMMNVDTKTDRSKPDPKGKGGNGPDNNPDK